MKASELTYDEWYIYMPKWKKALLWLFVVALPFIGSIDSINF